LALVIPGWSAHAQVAPSAFRFAEATIDNLQAQMSAGSLTAHELTAAYLERIAQLDKAGPKLNAVIELNPDALAIADQLDAERRAGHVRGPLHGIPIFIKDNIATADRMETTAGSLALVGDKPLRDAHIVTRLRAAGAIILGKTNLSEWANFRGDRSVGGWSGRGGQTHNPYALDRSPSGSSSGSAVAVSANFCVAAIGTETNGSIISPSSICGVVGLKPTLGAVSRNGIIPIAASFDTAGPITRTVRDAALLLAAIAGEDERDAVTRARPGNALSAVTAPWPAHALRGARIGWVRNANQRPNLDSVMAATVQSLREAGAEVIELGEAPFPADTSSAALEVMLYEMKDGVNAYLAALGPTAKMKSLADVMKFNDEHWALEQPLFGQQVFARAEAKGPLSEPAYLAALAQSRRISREEGIDALMDRQRLDAFIAVANGPAGLIAPPESGDPLFGNRGPSGAGAAPAARAGYPSITVPLAEISGLPVGLLFYGPAWSEAKLLGYAAEFESRQQARRPPTFLASAAGR
jgi:amidase